MVRVDSVMHEDRNPDGLSSANRVTFRDQHADREELKERFLLTVVFTDRAATLLAVKRAAELVHGVKASIRVLVVQTVPRSLPLTCPPIDPAFRARQFSTWFQDTPVNTFFDIRLCRDRNICLQAALEPHSVVIVGETRRHRWMKKEQRLADRLKAWGHEVILIPAEN
jgi:hypothetical protein